MRILIVTNYFPPEGGSGARLVAAFARSLVAAGDDVTVLCPEPAYHLSHQIPPDGLSLVRAGKPIHDALPHLLKRALEHLLRPMRLAAARVPTPDVIYAWYPPPAMAPLAVWLARRFQAPLLFHVQDLFPYNAQDLGLLPGGDLTAGLLERLLVPLYRRASHIVVHAPAQQAYFEALGCPTTTLPNPIDPALLDPPHAHARARNTPTESQQTHTTQGSPPILNPPHTHARARNTPTESQEMSMGQGDGPIHVLFAGILGRAQGWRQVLDAAVQLPQDGSIEVTLVGEGSELPALETELTRRRLPHVQWQPLLAPVEYRATVAACDIFLVPLAPGVHYPVIPSRLGDALAAGRAVVAAVPAGDAADLIARSGAGLVVPPGDGKAMARAILALAGSADMRTACGEAGRAYARMHLQPTRVHRELRALLESCQLRAGPHRG